MMLTETLFDKVSKKPAKRVALDIYRAKVSKRIHTIDIHPIPNYGDVHTGVKRGIDHPGCPFNDLASFLEIYERDYVRHKNDKCVLS